jgi:hypothetical protein
MSLDLDVESQIMYLGEGEVTPGDEAMVVCFKTKMADWECDIVQGTKMLTKEDMLAEMFHLQNSFRGYWCEGESGCDRMHLVVHKRKSVCWDCTRDPCAYNPPLVWDDAEKAYLHFPFHVMVNKDKPLDGATKQQRKGRKDRKRR